MSYIGTAPTIGNFQVCDAISVVNGQASYTMQVSGVNATPQSANHMLVSLNGILQAPNSSFTVSGSTITFASNLVTGDVIDFIQIIGSVLDLGVPSDNTVSLAKLTATGTKDATTFLRGDNSFQEVPAGGITMADQWRINNSPGSINNDDIIGTTNHGVFERIDSSGQGTIGSAMTESSGVFTFPSTGIYLVSFDLTLFHDSAREYVGHQIQVTTNNSSFSAITTAFSNLAIANSTTNYSQSNSRSLIDVTDTSNVKVNFKVRTSGSGVSIAGNTNGNDTVATFLRLGDT
jgi:hypothetical protein